MLQDLTKLYEGHDLAVSKNRVLYLPIVRPSTLLSIKVKTDEAQIGDAVFAVLLNDIELEDYVTITNGTKSGTLGELDIELADGDEFVLNLVSGNVSAPVTLSLTVDDGIAAGAESLDDLDDVVLSGETNGQILKLVDGVWTNVNESGGGGTLAGDVTGDADANTVEKIQGRNFFLPEQSEFFGDDFADGEVSTFLWNEYYYNSLGGRGLTVITEQNDRLEIQSADASDRRAGLYSKGTFNLTNGGIRVKIAAKSGTPAFQFVLFNGVRAGNNIEALNFAPSSPINKLEFGSGGSNYGANTDGVFVGYTLANGSTGYAGGGVGITGLMDVGDWCRFRHNSVAGNLYFETSANGTSWTTRFTVALTDLATVDFTKLKVALIGGSDDGGDDDAFIAFSNLESDIEAEDTIKDRASFVWNAQNDRFEPDNLGSGYSIGVHALTSSPVDSQTVYFGNVLRAPITTAGRSKVHIRKKGVIRIANITCDSGTVGTSESWSVYIRVNGTTDYLVQTIGEAINTRVWYNNELEIPVVDGDYFEVKVVNPAWATNPLTSTWGGYVYIQ